MTATDPQTPRLARVHRAACELVCAYGYDGFTMADLAARIGISRRTLFNTVPSKEAAVLGPEIGLDLASAAVFRGGGPIGDLLADAHWFVGEQLTALFPSTHDHPTVRQAQLAAINADPKVRGLAVARCHDVMREAETLLADREGWPPDDLRVASMTVMTASLAQLAVESTPPDGISVAQTYARLAAALADATQSPHATPPGAHSAHSLATKENRV